MEGTLGQIASSALCRRLIGCLQANEEPLMDQVLRYAIQHDYARYTSTLREAWRLSMAGLTQSFTIVLADPNYALELGPDQDFRSDPIAEFAVIEARRHRHRGVRLEMFLGLIKYYRLSFENVINASADLADAEKQTGRYILNRLFDRIEIGFCSEWSTSEDSHLAELQTSNRVITNEKNKYLTIFESLPFPVILLNVYHQIENLNHAATLMLGGDAVPGAYYYNPNAGPVTWGIENPGDHSKVNGLPPWLQSEMNAFADQHSSQYHSFEKTVDFADNPRILYVQISKMMDVSGKFAGSIVMIQDLTETRKAEKERERMQEQLLQSDKMASIGQLAAGVAHEINNPIGFVASNLNRLAEYSQDLIRLINTYQGLINSCGSAATSKEYLKSQLPSLEEMEKKIDVAFICDDIPTLVKECKDGVNRVQQIVIDLKDFAHPGISEPQYADINVCLESTMNVLRNEIKYKARLIKEFGVIPQILCQPRQLNQVFMNIIINAAQAIERNGEIHVRTQLKRGFIRIRISDNGCGIPPESVKKVFEPFFTTKPVGSGTGLGLHIAYQIVQQHKGRINVHSARDRGTTFTIDLPTEPDEIHVVVPNSHPDD